MEQKNSVQAREQQGEVGRLERLIKAQDLQPFGQCYGVRPNNNREAKRVGQFATGAEKSTQ
jgi:hypothetical protein